MYETCTPFVTAKFFTASWTLVTYWLEQILRYILMKVVKNFKEIPRKKSVVMMIMMHCFCQIVDGRNCIKLCIQLDHCRSFLPLQTFGKCIELTFRLRVSITTKSLRQKLSGGVFFDKLEGLQPASSLKGERLQ